VIFQKFVRLPSPLAGEGERARRALVANDVAFSPSSTRAEALKQTAARFTAAGIATPTLDARVLIAEALSIDAGGLFTRPDEPLGDGAARVATYAARRLAGEPVARILGRREFWGLMFELTPATLVPRPETETVVSATLAWCRRTGRGRGPLSILDLGTGSGALLVALLSELPGAWGVGVDIAPEALSTARRNAARHGVAARAGFLAGRWTAPLKGRFDIVVANPPYIPASDILTLALEVKAHDPIAALDGGRDGLDAYRAIAAGLESVLEPDGIVALEVGQGQATPVSELLAEIGLAHIETVHDLSGIGRVVVATR
jgi:release factor glutamine methyltransferase